jgi:cytochrome d ubiquinol oxidase subunit II
MSLNTLWFVLIGVLYSGYFILEGFDYGVGILLPFIVKDDLRRRIILNTIGPHWKANEVWLIVAGGATFAAFPGWYATLFSGFYIPLFLILLALIVRGVAIEFRSKDENPTWRSLWDWAFFTGSLIPALLWGVAFVNFVLGVPIDSSMNYVGGFWNLLSSYALIGGAVSLLGFILHGAIFLTLKTTGDLFEKAHKIVNRLYPAVLILLITLFIVLYYSVDKLGLTPVPTMITGLLAFLAVGWFVRQKKDRLAFSFSTITILMTVASMFLQLYPRVLVSSLNPEWSLTILNSSSGSMTLKIMSIVALVLVPVVMIYQIWSYWIFRKRITDKPESLEY